MKLLEKKPMSIQTAIQIRFGLIKSTTIGNLQALDVIDFWRRAVVEHGKR